MSEAELGSVKSIEWEVTGAECLEIEEPQVQQESIMEKGVVKFLLGIGGIILGISIAMMASSFHTIEEGHVGVYFKQGALVVSFAA